MPPRHAKRAKVQSPVIAPLPDVISHDPNRTSRLLELPMELLMEILSHFPHAPIEAPRHGMFFHNTPPASFESLERTDVLRALSQTCKQWRVIFFPLLWECVDVSNTRSRKPAWYIWVSRSLERKSLGLAQNPQHAAHVRCVKVVLSRCSTATVLPAFVHCLRALPNLHTLSILFAHTKMTTTLKSAFEGRKFSSVRTAILPNHAHNVLRSCSEVRRVICNFGDGSTLVSAMAKECKKVEVIEGFYPDEKMMKRIVKAAPNLRTVRFSCSVTPAALLLLSSSKNLVNIELQADVYKEAAIGNDARLVDCIKIAKEMLRKRQGTKSLIVSHYSYAYLSPRTWSKNIELD